jgi:hypothetical protein
VGFGAKTYVKEDLAAEIYNPYQLTWLLSDQQGIMSLPVLAEGERQIDEVIAFGMRRRGTPYLTDRRLIFGWSEGLLAKRYQQADIALTDVQYVNTKHPRLGGGELVITARDANNGFRSNRISLGIAMTPET